MNDTKLLCEMLERLANILDEIMPKCAKLVRNAVELLKMQCDAMKPIEIRKWHDGYVGDCPSCGRIVKFAQRYCHNCTRLLDWSEVLELPCEDDE